jgi:hypothetical protein
LLERTGRPLGRLFNQGFTHRVHVSRFVEKPIESTKPTTN